MSLSDLALENHYGLNTLTFHQRHSNDAGNTVQLGVYTAELFSRAAFGLAKGAAF